jgi:hypothetical protein
MVNQSGTINERLNVIRQDAVKGVKNIESYAKENAERGATAEYERGFTRRIEEFKQEINGELDDFRKGVLNRRPSPGESNYTVKMDKYKEFLKYANDGISNMKRIFSELFAKLYECMKRIIKWISDHFIEIVSLIIQIFSMILPLIPIM